MANGWLFQKTIGMVGWVSGVQVWSNFSKGAISVMYPLSKSFQFCKTKIDLVIYKWRVLKWFKTKNSKNGTKVTQKWFKWSKETQIWLKRWGKTLPVLKTIGQKVKNKWSNRPKNGPKMVQNWNKQKTKMVKLLQNGTKCGLNGSKMVKKWPKSGLKSKLKLWKPLVKS